MSLIQMWSITTKISPTKFPARQKFNFKCFISITQENFTITHTVYYSQRGTCFYTMMNTCFHRVGMEE